MPLDTKTFIKVKNGVASRVPLPEPLYGLLPESLVDLAWVGPSWEWSDSGWWPPEDITPQLGRFEAYGPGETLTVDSVRQVVIVLREIITLPNLARRITPLAFLSRFTSDETIAIEMAALDDPTAAVAVRHAAALIRSYLRAVMTAKYVFLDDVRTVAGVQYLESAGLLTSARAEEIIMAEVQLSEEA